MRPLTESRIVELGEALRLAVSLCTPLPTESVAFDAALGRVSTAQLLAPRDLPAWRNSGMDGYAVHSADVAEASADSPVTLRVAGRVHAGHAPAAALAPGTAVKVMTGAPVPDGTEGVIRVEDTDRGEDQVRIFNARDARANVRQRGEDLRSGDVVIAAGERLRPAHVGLFAALAVEWIAVAKRPQVAVVASGDELAPPGKFDDVRAGDRIASANSYSLAAIATEEGAVVVSSQTVADDRDALVAALRDASRADVVVISGGVSVGDSDFTRYALEQLGASVAFDRVRMRPGFNTAIGTIAGKPFVAVPGNPVSAIVAGEVLLRPMLRRLSAGARIHPVTVPVCTDRQIARSEESVRLLRARLTGLGDGPNVELTGAQGSARLSSVSRADCLVVVPRGDGAVEPGEDLRALFFGTPALSDEPWI